MEDKMIMIYPLIAIAIYAIVCCVDWADIFGTHSKASALRESILEWKDGWTYPPLEDIPARVEELKKETGLPVRLVLKWSDSGTLISRFYPKLDIDNIEAVIREQMEKGKEIDDTRVRTIISENIPPLPGFKRVPSHICVSIGFGEMGQPIDFNKTMNVIKKVFDNNEETEEN